MLSGSLLLELLVAVWVMTLFVGAVISLRDCVSIWKTFKKYARHNACSSLNSVYLDCKALRVGIHSTDVMICLLAGLHVTTSLVSLTDHEDHHGIKPTSGSVCRLSVNVGILARYAMMFLWPVVLIRNRHQHLRGIHINNIPTDNVSHKEMNDRVSPKRYMWSDVFKSRVKSLLTWILILHVILFIAFYFEPILFVIQTTMLVEIQMDLQSSPKLLALFKLVAIKQECIVLVGIIGTMCIAWAVHSIRMRIKCCFIDGDGSYYQTETFTPSGSQGNSSWTSTLSASDAVILLKNVASETAPVGNDDAEDDDVNRSWCLLWRDYLFPWIPLMINLVWIHMIQNPDTLIVFWAYSCVTCCLPYVM